MLSVLHIENVAVIEQADIVFESGFNVLTGETGAGKSIVIDAIGAILGARTYRDSIRTGSSKATVGAVFVGIPALPWFQEAGIPYDPDELLIQRELFLDGKNICRVNGQVVTVTLLRQLGRRLINIHGQHDSAQLFDEDSHLAILDAFADHGALLDDYLAAYEKMDGLRRKIKALTMDESEKLRRIETLQYQIDEIRRADLKPEEDVELEQRRRLMRSGEKIMDALEAASAALYGTDSQDGAASLTVEAARALATVEDVSPEMAALHQTVLDLSYAAEDAAEQVRDQKIGFAFSPEELEAVESRLDIIHRLRRKYGASCADILAFLDACTVELDEIAVSDDTIQRLETQLRGAEQAAQALSDQLTASRTAAGARLKTRLEAELRQLDMKNVQFACQLTPLPQLTERGGDNVSFLMSANAGETLKAMNRVASGGELARIMLALKTVLSEKDQVPTLIFDEVDTGVSGRAAQKVAEKMADIARSKQVLCVTHLPQLAAMADFHFSVEKGEQNGRTYTAVTKLDRPQRQQELARLTGGTVRTKTILEGAGELLDAAETYKREAKGNPRPGG